MKRPTCSINDSKCPLHHLNVPSCDSEKSFCLPCEDQTNVQLEDLKGRIEDFRLENGIDY